MNRPSLYLAALFASLAVACGQGAVTGVGDDGTNDDAASAGTVKVNPAADAFVVQTYPSQNFGTATTLRTDGSPLTRSYLKFSVSSLPGTVQSAKLKLYVTESNPSVSVSRTSASWSETGLTWSNQPGPSGNPVASGTPVAGSWLTLDVSSVVKDTGTYAFVLTTSSSSRATAYSREGAYPPQLVIATAVPDAGSTTPADAGNAQAVDAGSSTSGGLTYEQAISYTQNRPAFTPARTILVSSASELKNAITNLQAGDLVKATASFTVPGETVISKRLSSPAVIDLSGYTVKFEYSGGQNVPAVWVKNAQNIRIYGGVLTTDDTGGSCITWYGSQHVLWWGFVAHDCGGTGIGVTNTKDTSFGAVANNDIQGEIYQAGKNWTWDPHYEKGSGEHGVNLADSSNGLGFVNNRFAFYIHDQPSGACIEYGLSAPEPTSGNVLYEKADGCTFVSTIQTGGNAIQFWGYALDMDIKYLEASNLQGYAAWAGGTYGGQSQSGVTIEYGRASNTNNNPRYAGHNPWDTSHSIHYEDVSPSP